MVLPIRPYLGWVSSHSVHIVIGSSLYFVDCPLHGSTKGAFTGLISVLACTLVAEDLNHIMYKKRCALSSNHFLWKLSPIDYTEVLFLNWFKLCDLSNTFLRKISYYTCHIVLVLNYFIFISWHAWENSASPRTQ